MNILIVDTTDTNLIVALIAGDKRLSFSSQSQSKKHNSTLLPAVEDILSSGGIELKDLDALSCVCGPGSFTGIRLGVTAINGLASGLNKPIISLNTLEVIAFGVKGKALAMVDANHGNYYVGIYNDSKCVLLDNYDSQQVKAFSGNTILRDDKYLNKLFEITEKKYNNASFTSQLTPLYMKLSQAEREQYGNN